MVGRMERSRRFFMVEVEVKMDENIRVWIWGVLSFLFFSDVSCEEWRESKNLSEILK